MALRFSPETGLKATSGSSARSGLRPRFPSDSNDVIYLEDLNIQGMLKNRKLSKAIADVGLYELKRQLVYKAQ
jgi:hypothetical protein